jgi:type 1 fimbria pilin
MHHTKLFLGVFALALSQPSWAIICKGNQDQSEYDQPMGGANFYREVAAGMPINYTFIRAQASGEPTAYGRCWMTPEEQAKGEPQEIYFHVNPAWETMGSGVEVGLHGVNTKLEYWSGATIPSGVIVYPCPTPATTAAQVRTCTQKNFSFPYGRAMRKSAAQVSPTGVSPDKTWVAAVSGKDTTAPEFATNLHLTMSRMSGITGTPCWIEVTPSSPIVNFGKIWYNDIGVIGGTNNPGTREFSIRFTKHCDTPLSVKIGYLVDPSSVDQVTQAFTPTGGKGLLIQVGKRGPTGEEVNYLGMLKLNKFLDVINFAANQRDETRNYYSRYAREVPAPTELEAGVFSALMTIEVQYP